MWPTSQGDRTLTGHEADLVRRAVAYSRDMITVGIELGEPHQTDVRNFNLLQPTQQLAVLHEVAFALLDRRTPMPELNSIREATVHMLFRELVSLVEIEIDLTELEDQPHFNFRSSIISACEQLSNSNNESSQFSEFGCDFFDFVPPNVDCDNVERWSDTLDALADQILWDRDFEMEFLLADSEPQQSELIKESMGIGADYYVVPAPDIFSDEHRRIDCELVELTSTMRNIFETQSELVQPNDTSQDY